MLCAAFFTMWRGMLGEFDISTLSSKSAVVMYLVFQGVVVVLMMNLIIAIMGGTLYKLKR